MAKPLTSFGGLPRPRLGDRCAVCARPLTGTVNVAVTGEFFCDRHSAQQRCIACGMPAGEPPVGELPSCPRCAATAVGDRVDVKRVLPPIVRQLHALGVRTTTRVQVRLVGMDELPQAGAPNAHTLGVTVRASTTVTDLMVLRGLPEMQFGATVAHEAMHVYFGQEGYERLPPPVEEGLCQLLAYAWLRRQGGLLAVAAMRLIELDRGPVYGDGFRAAKAVAEQVGVRRTLEHVKQHGTLPR
jgi:hypothetical protein